jgi:hypothetical protein
MDRQVRTILKRGVEVKWNSAGRFAGLDFFRGRDPRAYARGY